MQIFSPEKANALIPVLTPLIDELLRKRRELAIKLLENDPGLLAARGRPGGPPVGSKLTQRKFAELKAEIVRIVERIEAHGCVMKDLDLGLLDFPAVRAGRPVYLCWKAGEPSVAFWHAMDEGFGSREPLK